jgi:putative peptidoglycan lipid II flippase
VSSADGCAAMTLAKRVLTISGWTFMSRVLGLVRDRLFAGQFGASPLLDAFFVAFQLPNLLRNLFGEGALSAAFIPRYVQLRASDPAAADEFAGRVLSRLALWLALLSAAAMAVAAVIYVVGTPRAQLVSKLAIPQMPFLCFICVSAIMAGVLNGRGHFFIPAFAPVILNLCLIATIFLGPEQEIRWLPYAVLAAGLSQVVLHAWGLKRTSGGVPPLRLDSDAHLRELRTSVVPVLFSSSIYQINAFLDSMIAYAFLGEKAAGAVAILYFGNRLLQFPMAMIGHGVTTAAYPELARQAGGGWAATGIGMREAAKMLSFFLLPAAAGLAVVADPLVRTIYMTGEFDVEEVRRTVLVTQFLALALLPISLSKLQLRAFHVHRDQRTPMRISIAMVLCNLILNVFLVQTPLHEAGLALATAISSFAGCVVFALILRARGCGALVHWAALVRPIIATAAMTIAVWCALRYLPAPRGDGSWAAAQQLAIVVALGAAVYFSLAGVGWLRRRRSATQERP